MGCEIARFESMLAISESNFHHVLHPRTKNFGKPSTCPLFSFFPLATKVGCIYLSRTLTYSSTSICTVSIIHPPRIHQLNQPFFDNFGLLRAVQEQPREEIDDEHCGGASSLPTATTPTLIIISRRAIHVRATRSPNCTFAYNSLRYLQDGYVRRRLLHDICHHSRIVEQARNR
jgi:hypothetical protein